MLVTVERKVYPCLKLYNLAIRGGKAFTIDAAFVLHVGERWKRLLFQKNTK